MKIPLHIVVIVLSVLIGAGVTSAWAVDTPQAVCDLVLQTYDLDPEHYEIEILSNRLETRLVDPEDLTFCEISRKDPIGLFTIMATINHGGEVIDKGQVRMRIRRFEDVLVSAGRLNRYQQLTAELFELKRTEVTSLREQSIGSFDEILHQRLKRNLHKGDILTKEAMESIPDIEVGEEVTIVYSDGLCNITVPGKVLQTGWVGHAVRVKNEVSGKIISARVVDDRSVAVDP